MSGRRWLRGVVFSLVLFAPVRTQAAEVLRLDDVLRSVDEHHPELAEMSQRVNAAEADAWGARGMFDPRMSVRSTWLPVGYYQNGQLDAVLQQTTPWWGTSVFAGYRLGWGSYPVYKGALQTLSAGEIRAGIEVPLWKDGRIDAGRARIAQTRVLRDAAELSWTARRLKLQQDAAKAYWAWVAAGLQVEVARRMLDLAGARTRALEAQVEAGALESIILIDNQRTLLDRSGKLLAAERKFASSTLELSLYLRDAEAKPIIVDASRRPSGFPDVAHTLTGELDREIEEALAIRPDLQLLRAMADVAEVERRLARNQRAPQIDVQTFVAKDFGVGPENLAPLEWGAGLVVDLPIGLRSARADLKAAQAEVAAAQERIRGLSDRVAVEVRVAHVALTIAARSLDVARQQVVAADALAAAERTRFAEGGSDLVVLNLRELAAADAASFAIDTQADFQRAWVDFMASTGRSPLGGI